MLFYFLLGFIAACLTIFINYCIGKPGTGDFSPNEIFSVYTIKLSSRVLKDFNLYNTYRDQLFDSINNARPHEVRPLLNDFYKIIYQSAEPYFTWEKALGMCQICSGFWISLATGLCFTHNFFNLLIIIVISHVTIRVLSKIL